MGSKNLNLGVSLLGNVHHVESNPFSFTVTIGPKDKQLAPLGVILNILDYTFLLFIGNFLKLHIEEIIVGSGLP